MKARQFIDHVTIEAHAGRGGDGSASFRREAHVEYGGPDGGDGGRGGHVILRGNRHDDSLVRLFFERILRAGNGEPGRGRQMHGRNASDLVVNVPCGTSVYEPETDTLLHDITEHDQTVVIAAGGRGGIGNVHFKSSTHQAPTECTPGQPGQSCRLRLELKTIADLALVGFPNAGKSSLLAALSSAHPKIGAYPFTTLHPVIGTVEYPDFSQIRIADIPGLIDGAHQGAGLGVDFLRHLARAKTLIYVIDVSGSEGRHPWDDYRVLRHELECHDPTLLKRRSVLVANKLDMPGAMDNVALLSKRARRRVIPVSAATGTGLDELRARLHDMIRPLPPGVAQTPASASGSRARASRSDHDLVSPNKLQQAGFLDLDEKFRRRR